MYVKINLHIYAFHKSILLQKYKKEEINQWNLTNKWNAEEVMTLTWSTASITIEA